MIRLVAVGKLKEKYLTEACEEYLKRLVPYTKVQVIQVADEKCPEGLSDSGAEKVLNAEGSRILDHIPEKDYVITLEIEGKRLSSEAFSRHLEKLRGEGRPDITFVIGGSLGLSAKVRQRSDFRLSFSDMTFPHQLMRVILLEQLYRSFKIARNEPYHK